MKVVIISDTHGAHRQLTLPAGDLLIHCGDFTNRGRDQELFEFNVWLEEQDFQHKVVVPGNHDVNFEHHTGLAKAMLSAADHILIDEEVVIEGRRIYGTPWTPIFRHRWGFQYERGEREWDEIPAGLDLLISHGPPAYTLDWVERDGGVATGDWNLRHAIERARPRYVAFGHIHENGGMSTLRDGIVFMNAASMVHGKAKDVQSVRVRPPLIIEI